MKLIALAISPYPIRYRCGSFPNSDSIGNTAEGVCTFIPFVRWYGYYVHREYSQIDIQQRYRAGLVFAFYSKSFALFTNSLRFVHLLWRAMSGGFLAILCTCCERHVALRLQL